MVVAIVVTLAFQHARWHPFYSEMFRADPTGPPNHVAVVSWFGTDPPFSARPGGTPGPLMIDLYTWPGDGTPKELLTSTKVADGFYVSELTTHRFYYPVSFDESGREINHFGNTFLAAMVNGGQHSRLVVWWFDPHSLRPVEMLSVLYGDPKRLDKGIVTENTPANYVHPDDWPSGVSKRSDYISRDWALTTKGEFKFVPGPWRLKK